MFGKWTLVFLGISILLFLPVFPRTIQDNSPSILNNDKIISDSTSCILVAQKDSTSKILQKLEARLGEIGACLFKVPDSLDVNELLQEMQHRFAIEQQDSLLLVGIAPSLSFEIPVWSIVPPFLPEMDSVHTYSFKTDSSLIDVVPTLLQLTEGTIDSASIDDLFENCHTGIIPLLLRAVVEYFAISEDDSVNYNLELYSKLKGFVDESSLSAGWLTYNYAGIAESENETDCYIRADSIFAVFDVKIGQALCQLALARLGDNLENTRSYYENVLDFCEAQLDTVTEAKVYLAMVDLSKESGQLTAAEMYVERAAIAHEQIGDVYEATLLYTELGEIKRSLGQLIHSDSVLKKALHLAESMQSETNILKIHYQLGLTKTVQGNIDSAIVHYLAAADLMEIIGDSFGMAKVDNKLGTIYLKRNEYNLAQIKYESALSLFETLTDSSGILQSHFNLGELTADQQRWENSQFHFKQALEIAQDLTNDRLMGTVLYAKGIAHIKEGKYTEGYEEIKESFELTDGSVYGTFEESQRFLAQLEALVEGEKEILSKKKALESEL